MVATPAELGRQFPRSFVWGVASSAYQIEGSPLSDGAGQSDWHQFCSQKGQGRIVLDHDGNIACDHYRRYRDDVQLMFDLGIPSYRLSIAWARILPDGVGRVNQRGLDFYRRLMDTLAEFQIQPMVTLYHWDMPAALAARGGWANPDVAEWFREYAETVFAALDDRVGWWATMNEPWVVTHFGYGEGTHPPAIQDYRQVPRVSAHLLRAHAAAVTAYRGIGRRPIGLVVNLGPQHAASDRESDQHAAARADAYLNRQFLQPALQRGSPAELSDMFGSHWVEPFPAGPPPAIDFVGVNYYTRQVVRASADRWPVPAVTVPQTGRPHTAMNWEIYPAGLTETLRDIDRQHRRVPIFITENGAALDDTVPRGGRLSDPDRVRFFAEHLEAAAHAMAAGVNLQGYFAWSLLDNFEWTFGLTKRFGLVHVDFSTQKRTPKSSARFFQEVIHASRRRSGVANA